MKVANNTNNVFSVYGAAPETQVTHFKLNVTARSKWQSRYCCTVMVQDAVRRWQFKQLYSEQV